MKKKNDGFAYPRIKIDLPFLGYIASSLVLNAVMVVAILLLGRYLPPEVPLFYGLAQGEEQLVHQWVLIIPSLVSLFIILLNSSLSLLIKNDFLKQVLVISGVLATFFSLVTTVKIILLVGSF